MDFTKINVPLAILLGVATLATLGGGVAYFTQQPPLSLSPPTPSGNRQLIFVWAVMPQSSRFPTTYGSPNHVGRSRSPLIRACVRSLTQHQNKDDIVILTENNILSWVSPEMERLLRRHVSVLGSPSNEVLRDAALLDIISYHAGIVVPVTTVMLERPLELEKAIHSGVLSICDTDVRPTVMVKPLNEGGDDDVPPVMSFDKSRAPEQRVLRLRQTALKLAHSQPDSYLQNGGLRTQLKRNDVAMNVFPASQIGLRDQNGFYVSMERLVDGGTQVRQATGGLRPRLIRLAPEQSRMLRREDQWVYKASIAQIVEGGSSLGLLLESLNLDDDIHPEDFPLHLGTSVEVPGVETRRKDPLLLVQDD